MESNFSDPDKYRGSNSEDEKDNQEIKVQTQDACIGPLTTDELDPEAEVENANNLSVESYYILEDLSREGLQKYLKESMLVFNEKYPVDKKQIDQNVIVSQPTLPSAIQIGFSEVLAFFKVFIFENLRIFN